MSDRLSTSDPATMRALAHPLRLDLLDLLGDGPLTATQCAEATGESVASCAYHLGTLAKYGYVEPAPRNGREKPWRLTVRRRDSRYDPAEPGSHRAAGELARVAVDRERDRLHHWLDTAPADEWLLASVLVQRAAWLTVEELAEVSAELGRIGERFADRERPPGARRVRIFASANADPEGER